MVHSTPAGRGGMLCVVLASKVRGCKLCMKFTISIRNLNDLRRGTDAAGMASPKHRLPPPPSTFQSLLYYVIELIRAVCAFSARLEISILFVSQPQPLVIPTPPEVADGATI